MHVARTAVGNPHWICLWALSLSDVNDREINLHKRRQQQCCLNVVPAPETLYQLRQLLRCIATVPVECNICRRRRKCTVLTQPSDGVGLQLLTAVRPDTLP